MAGGQMQQQGNVRPPPTTPTTALAKVESSIGSYRDPAVITARMRQLMDEAHLVSPATECGSLAEGCEVALSAVLIDTNTPEVYGIAGDRGSPDETVGLSKTALDRIAGAVGGTWVIEKSGRLDDRSDPRYVHYRAVLRVMDFDGSIREFPGEVEIDARDGSPQIEEIIEKAKNAKDQNGNAKPRDPKPQIVELRKFLLRHAESKAMNRAIRKLGVRTSYKRKELAKPFVAARVLFTGRTDDAELRRIFAGKIADTFLASRLALFGGGTPAALPAAPPARVIDVGHAPPPVGAVSDYDEDDDYVPFGNEPQRTPPPAATQPPPRQADPAPAAAPATPPSGNGNGAPKADAAPPTGIDTSQYTVPFGRNKGLAISDAQVTDRDLEYIANAMREGIADPAKSKFRAKNQALLDAVLAEQGYRLHEATGGQLPLDGDRGADAERY